MRGGCHGAAMAPHQGPLRQIPHWDFQGAQLGMDRLENKEEEESPQATHLAGPGVVQGGLLQVSWAER